MAKKFTGIIKPPEDDKEMEKCKEALDAMLVTYGDNKNEMARKLGFTRNAISWWFSKGYVGSQAALRIEEETGLAMAKIRPDIHSRRQHVAKKLEEIAT